MSGIVRRKEGPEIRVELARAMRERYNNGYFVAAPEPESEQGRTVRCRG